MRSNTKTTVLVAAAGLVVAGVIVAIVATQFGSSGTNAGATTTNTASQPPGAPVADGAGTRVAQLVAAARAQQQARLVLTKAFFNGFFASLSAAAHYFGITWPVLRGRLETGKSLAQLAGSAGKSKSDLVAVMLAAHKRYLDGAVSRHEIDKAQEQELLADVDPWMNGVVDGTGSNKGFGGTLASPLPGQGRIPAPAAIPAP